MVRRATAEDFPGHPKAVYEWDYLASAGACDSPRDTGRGHSVVMSSK